MTLVTFGSCSTMGTKLHQPTWVIIRCREGEETCSLGSCVFKGKCVFSAFKLCKESKSLVNRSTLPELVCCMSHSVRWAAGHALQLQDTCEPNSKLGPIQAVDSNGLVPQQPQLPQAVDSNGLVPQQPQPQICSLAVAGPVPTKNSQAQD